MKKAFLGLLCAVPSFLFAQWLGDDFSDANFTNNPTWQGDTAKFVVNADSQLQLLAPPATGTAWLYLPAPTHLGQPTTWELYLSLGFAPSDNNRLTFWLAASSADPNAAQGYFLRIGETGNQDALRLYRQDGPGQTTLLASGTPGAAANNPTLRLRIERDSAGFWQLLSDMTGGQSLLPEGPAVRDTTYAQGLFSGLWCRYTATNAQKFFFDDVLCGPLWSDTLPPQCLGATVLSDTLVELRFNEPLDSALASDPARYAFFPACPVQSAAFAPGDTRTVWLRLGDGLQSGVPYQLRAQGLADPAGNVLSEAWVSLLYQAPVAIARYDLVFSEIYPDPSPSFGLPPHEFVELHNRSAQALPLSGIRLQDLTGAGAHLPNDTLLPGEFLLLTNPAGQGAVSIYGKTIGLAGFPTLNDDGDTLVLLDASGSVLDAVGYGTATYDDPDKSGGGWTLVRRDLDQPCVTEGNWTVSENVLLGGTPGTGNTGALPVSSVPIKALRVWPESDNRLLLWFSGSLDASLAALPQWYMLENGPSVITAEVLPPLFDRVRLHLATGISAGQMYTLRIAAEVPDCSGSPRNAGDTLRIALPQSAVPGDLVINELLFDPKPYGSDFVELYNASQKVLHTGDFILANADAAGLANEKARLPGQRLIFPGEYLLCTPDTAFLLANYTCPVRGALLPMALPEMPDDSGQVLLLGLLPTGDGVLLEKCRFSEDMHSLLLPDPEGVSLERRDPVRPTESPDQWHSASAETGFATPGYRNAHQGAAPAAGSDWLWLPDGVFTPNADGHQDELTVAYQIEAAAGLSLHLRLYDSKGIWLRDLASGLFLQGNGTLHWDGSLSDGRLAPEGAYLLRAEAVRDNGEVWRKKLVGVLAR